MKELENKLDELLVKKAPYQLPENARAAIVKAMPWLTLIGGVLMALAAWQLYHLTTLVDMTGSYYSTLSNYGYNMGVPAVSPLVWVGLLALAVEAVLFIVAFPALKEHKKSGWNLLYWVSLLNVVYAVINLFVEMNLGSLISSLIGSLIGLYILFQIRSYYTAISTTGAATSRPTSPTTPSASSSDKQ